MKFFYTYFSFLAFSFSFISLSAEESIGRHRIDDLDALKNNPDRKLLVKFLWSTKAFNTDEVYHQLLLHHENNGRVLNKNGLNFKTLNPYYPRFHEFLALSDSLKKLIYGEPEHLWSVGIQKHPARGIKKITHYSQEQIVRWYAGVRRTYQSSHQVCAFRFSSQSQEKNYYLKTFVSSEAAELAGYTVTHQEHCGTCSSLRDLAVYNAKPDLTSPVRTCVQKPSKLSNEKVFDGRSGFSENCAESWAYNGSNTKELCQRICLLDYGNGSLIRGLYNVLRGKFEGPNTRKGPDGREVLRPCLACDEYRSGPAFKYTAARTRELQG